MKIIENKNTCFINGYLEAMSDIEGPKHSGVFATSRMLISCYNDLQKELSFAFNNVYGAEIIKGKKFNHPYAHEILFKKLILQKPFGGSKIKLDVLRDYRDYIIFHLVDYIDFAFDAEGVTQDATKNIILYLIKNSDRCCISLVIAVQDYKFIFLFTRKDFNEEQFSKWYHEILTYYDDTKNIKSKRHKATEVKK